MSFEDTDPPLPPELWSSIIPHISINDSCSLALVCRSMWGRAREHNKWTYLEINWNILQKRGAATLFNCPSFNKVNGLILKEDSCTSDSSTDSDDDNEVINEVLECCLNCNTLKEIEFKLDVSQASPALLAGALSGLTGVSFSYGAHLTNPQLTRILEESPDLVKLEVPYRKMLKNKTNRLLGNMATQLTKLDISNSTFAPRQMKHLLEKCLQSTTLKDLKISGTDLSEVSPILLGNVCARLQTVDIRATTLRQEQITAILNASSTSATLKSIDFTNNWNMTKVSLQLLCTIVPKLETVKLKKCLLDSQLTDILLHSLSSATLKKLSYGTSCQCIIMKRVKSTPRRYQLDLSEQGPFMHSLSIQAILCKAVETSSLSKLDLSGINLSSHPAILLASLSSQLHTINLAHTRLTARTITIIFTALLQSTTTKELNLSDNILTHVAADLMTRVADKLEKFTAEAAGLTTDQAQKMMQTSAVCCFGFNDLSKVDPEVIYRNCRKNSLVDNKNTSLTTSQIEAILQKYCQCNDELRTFTISYQNLSKVSVDLISEVVSKFIAVSLDNCQLTEGQVTGILQKSLESTTLKSLRLFGNELHINMAPNLLKRLYQLGGRAGKFYRFI